MDGICWIIRSELDPSGAIVRSQLGGSLIEPIHRALDDILHAMAISPAHATDTRRWWAQLDPVYAMMYRTRDTIFAAAGHKQGEALKPTTWALARSILCIELCTVHIDALSIHAHRQTVYPFETPVQRLSFDNEAIWRLTGGLKRILDGIRTLTVSAWYSASDK